MPAGTAKQSAAAQPEPAQPEPARPVKPPVVEQDDEDLAAMISTAYEPPSTARPASTAAEPKVERARIFALGQYVEKLKETHKDVKQFDVFVCTDTRTELRSETSKAGKACQRYIVQPLLINCLLKDGGMRMIKRPELTQVFGLHYLALFYSQYSVIKVDFKLNIASIDATPTVRGDYANYGYRFKPIDDTQPISAKFAKTYASLEPPVVQAFQPKRYADIDYSKMDISEPDEEEADWCT
jgi:hypothetical protein